jgi:hypothetical protein
LRVGGKQRLTLNPGKPAAGIGTDANAIATAAQPAMCSRLTFGPSGQPTGLPAHGARL